MANILRIGMNDALSAARGSALERAGHTVSEAHDIRQLVTACSGVKFDLIIIGQNLPTKEKMRVSALVREHCRDTKVLELHSTLVPELNDADEHLRLEGESAEALTEFVGRLTARHKSA